MSTDHYVEVNGDDSTLVPPQGNPQSDWPKKIRTLSAGELDRLTIDGAGRFYWDGHLVNYQAQQAQAAPAEMDAPRAADQRVEPMMGRSPDSAAVDLDALAILDRAALELSDRRPAEPQVEPVVAAPPVAEVAPAAPAPVDLAKSMEDYLAQAQSDVVQTPVHVTPVVAPALETPAPVPSPTLAQPRARMLELVESSDSEAVPTRSDKVRVSLSGGQCVALFVVIVALLVGAAGVAAQGVVAAHEWGCRTGAIKAYCPAPPPAPKAPAGSDLSS